MESSAINTPHPDGPPSDGEADLFFGGGEEEAAPAASEPVAKQTEDKSGGWPDLAPEDAKANAEAYREAHGEGEPLHTQVAQPKEPPAEAPKDEGEPAAADPPVADASGPAETGGTTGSTTESAPAEAAPGEPSEDDAADGEANGEAKKSGPLEREYIVFHEVALTKRVLEHLLAQIEEGAEARVAHFELHRVKTRNVNHAAGAAYRKHQSRFGTAKVTLHAVSEKSFQKRTVEPRERPVETDLSIK